MSLEDLNFKIKADAADAMSPLLKLNDALTVTTGLFDRVSNRFATLPTITQQSTSQMTGLQTQVANTDRAFGDLVKNAVYFEETMARQASVDALKNLTGTMTQLRIESQATANSVQLIANNSSRATPARRSSGGGLQAIAATVQVVALAKISSGMKSVGETARATSAAFQNFRSASLAPKVDPKLNLLKTGVEQTGNSVAKFIEKFRGVADASITGFSQTLVSIGAALSLIIGSFDRAGATLSKFLSTVQTSSAGLKLLQTVFFPLAKQFGVATGPLKAMSEALGTASTKFTQFTAQAGAVKNGVAGIGYVMTGTFAKGGSSADIFARSMQFALFPLRLLKREFDGANRVVRATMHVFNAITSPVRLVTNTFARMRAETAVFNQVVSKLPARLQTPAKAFYYLAQAARVPIMAVLGVSKAVTTVLGPLGRLGGSAIAKASTGLRSLAVSASGFIGRAIGLRSAAKGAADSIDSMGAAAGRSSGGIMSLIPGLGQAGKFAFAAKAGIAALAAGIVMWGSSSAIATESATVSFGTMLKDMDQGKAVIAAITKFSGETPFSNSDLRDAGKLLLTAQVPADQLINKLRMLGDVASGTGKPIEEYAAIFQKVKNTGKFGLEQINQLAERGVPIYGQLQSQLGVTREELGTMISAGKLGFNDMEKALEGLTTGQGLFAGGMAAQSQTFAGLWSTLKDNVAIVLEKIVGGFTMMLKPAMSFAIVVLQKIATGFTALEPVIMGVMASVSSMMNSVWTGIQSVVSSVFGSIFGDTSGTFDSIITYAAMMMGAAGYAFENLGTIASFAFKSAQLSAAIWINDIVYFFSATMPAYLTWFGDNFSNIFLDAAAIVGTVFANIGKNIMSAMTAIWDFIKSGGTKSLTMAWTPLLDGFQSIVSELPNVPARAMTEMESKLQADLGSMGTNLGTGFSDAMTAAVDSVKNQTDVQINAVADQAGRIDETANDTAESGNKRTNFAVDSLDRGSEAALKAVFANSQGDTTGKQAVVEHKTTNKLLTKLVAKNTAPSPAVQGAV